jgi:hypothetical protein
MHPQVRARLGTRNGKAFLASFRRRSARTLPLHPGRIELDDGALEQRTLIMAKAEHLSFIQNVIARMAQNSFTVKGWSITVVGILLGFATERANQAIAALAIWALLAFAWLDAYYLALERAFRKLYGTAAIGPDDNWDMTPTLAPAEYFKALARPVIFIFHGVTLVVAVVVTILLG